MRNYFGVSPWSDHHPVFSSLLIGGLMHLGRTLVGDNFGLFLISLLQHVSLAASCAYACMTLQRMEMPMTLRVGALLYLALHPLIAFWPATVIKDTLSYALLMIYSASYLEIMLRSQKLLARPLSLTLLSGFFASLLRHSNIYVCVIPLMLLILQKQSVKRRRLYLVAAICLYFAVFFASQGLIAATGATQGSIREMLSLPFQQTARTLRDHPDSITAQEMANIDAVLDYEKIAEAYTSGLSDYVKNTYRENDAKLPKYFKTWLSMGLKYPVSYLEAAIGNMYGYLCPNGDSMSMPVVFYMDKSQPHYTGFINVEYTFSTPTIRRGMYDGLLTLKKIPGPSVLFYAGNYTWFLLFLMLAVCRAKRYGALIAFSPAFINILTCVASPVNGSFRYFLPTLMSVPLMLCWSVWVLRRASE